MVDNLPRVSCLRIQAPLCLVAPLVTGAVLYLPVEALTGAGAQPAAGCPMARARCTRGLGAP